MIRFASLSIAAVLFAAMAMPVLTTAAQIIV